MVEKLQNGVKKRMCVGGWGLGINRKLDSEEMHVYMNFDFRLRLRYSAIALTYISFIMAVLVRSYVLT